MKFIKTPLPAKQKKVSKPIQIRQPQPSKPSQIPQSSNPKPKRTLTKNSNIVINNNVKRVIPAMPLQQNGEQSDSSDSSNDIIQVRKKYSEDGSQLQIERDIKEQQNQQQMAENIQSQLDANDSQEKQPDGDQIRDQDQAQDEDHAPDEEQSQHSVRSRVVPPLKHYEEEEDKQQLDGKHDLRAESDDHREEIGDKHVKPEAWGPQEQGKTRQIAIITREEQIRYDKQVLILQKELASQKSHQEEQRKKAKPRVNKGEMIINGVQGDFNDLNSLKISYCYTKFQDKELSVKYDYFMKRFSEANQRILGEFLKAQGQSIIPNNKNRKVGARKLFNHKPEDQISMTLESYGQGWLYSDQQYHQLVFDPEQLDFDRLFFVPAETQQKLDCLAHAVNYAVGYALFRCREQVVRVAAKKWKISKQKALELKSRNGMSFSSLNNIVCSNESMYNLDSIAEWTYDSNDLYWNDFESFIYQQPQKTFIIVYSSSFPILEFSHAVTIKKCANGLAYLDSADKFIRYSQAKKKKERWEIMEFLKQAKQIEVFIFKDAELEPEVLDQEIKNLKSLFLNEAKEVKREYQTINQRKVHARGSKRLTRKKNERKHKMQAEDEQEGNS